MEDACSFKFGVTAHPRETFQWLLGRAEKSGAEVTKPTEMAFAVSWRGAVIDEGDPAAVVQVEVGAGLDAGSLVICTVEAPAGRHFDVVNDYAGPLGESMGEIVPLDSTSTELVQFERGDLVQGDATAEAPAAQGHPSLQHLGRIARKIANVNVAQHETVHEVIKGTDGQCLIVLDDRLVIVKPPGMLAGMRSQTTAFPYRNISALELNMGVITGAIEVIAPGYDGKHKTNRWGQNDRNDRMPQRISNCLPMNRTGVKTQREAIERVKERINAAQTVKIAWAEPVTPAPTPAADRKPLMLADELQKLATLRDQGILTSEEFETQKRRLLDFDT